MIAIDGLSANDVRGDIDTLKFRSSMMLFDAVCPNDIFQRAL